MNEQSACPWTRDAVTNYKLVGYAWSEFGFGSGCGRGPSSIVTDPLLEDSYLIAATRLESTAARAVSVMSYDIRQAAAEKRTPPRLVGPGGVNTRFGRSRS